MKVEDDKIDSFFSPSGSLSDCSLSDKPGAHERHLIRRDNNVLFGDRSIAISRDLLQDKQKLDRDILEQFLFDFRAIVNKAAELKPNEDSDVVLSVKNELDKLYAVSVSVADDQSKVQASISKLLSVVMSSVKKGAEQDPQALQELSQEEAAREAHFAFLQSTLVADLLNPESPIKNEDLLPTLLCAKKDDLALAIQLFDKEQMPQILIQGKELLDKLSSETQVIDQTSESQVIVQAIENYVFMEGYLKYLEQV